MARPETLIPGNCYFSVSFYDTDLLLPIVQTLLYVGEATLEGNGRRWLFKEPEGLPDLEEPNAGVEPRGYLGLSDRQLYQIEDFDGLMRRLREIASNHPLTPLPRATAEPATEEELESVSAEVARFLNDPELMSLTMTIRFTDDGFSLRRRERGYGIGFFARPRLDSDEESRILSFFESDGIHPVVDYLAERGRQRVLEFPIPGEIDAMVGLCRRLLTEVHSMRRGDRLDYHPLRESDLAKRADPAGEA